MEAWLILISKGVYVDATKVTILTLLLLLAVSQMRPSQTVLIQIMFWLMEDHMSFSNTLLSIKNILNSISDPHLLTHNHLYHLNSPINILDTQVLTFQVSMEEHFILKELVKIQLPQILLNGRITNQLLWINLLEEVNWSMLMENA